MTWFLLKGLLRDRQRSLFPILIVAGGVMITILVYCWLLGVVDDFAKTNAKLDTGHVKVMTRAYSEISSQLPNDLALSNISGFIDELKKDYPKLDWAPRIKFGGLLDFPDANGETRAQGPVFGIAMDMISTESKEKERLGLEEAIVRGNLPRDSGEIIVSEKFAQELGVQPGEMATLISATSNGGMAIHNFTISGTVTFGVAALDRNAMLADISDVQYALDMENGAGEILGYMPDMIYKEKWADTIADEFNGRFKDSKDELLPTMRTLMQQNNLEVGLNLVKMEIVIITAGMIFVMSIVLWNTGLMSGLRRYGEIGVRLAVGESKGHVYCTMILESLLTGIIGSVLGTVIGVGLSYYFQKHGLDMSGVMKGAKMMMSNKMRAMVTPTSFYIGLIPGLVATMIGTMIAGIGIFKRQTSQLFKELET
jgi:putative ABC transport system permease protein